MNNKFLLSGAPYYHIQNIEDENDLISKFPDDPYLEKRIELKREINMYVYRIANAHQKIKLMLQIKKKYLDERQKKFSAEVPIEYEFAEDIINVELLKIAELFKNFAKILNENFPRKYSSLFSSSKKIRSKMNEDEWIKYTKTQFNLFGEEIDLNKNHGKIDDKYFKDLGTKLKELVNPILKCRNKIIAHPFDEERHSTFLTLIDYHEILETCKEFFESISIVGTLTPIHPKDWTPRSIQNENGILNVPTKYC